LPGNHVQALLVDAADRVWVAVEGEGVSVLDASRQRFTHYRKVTHPSLASDDVWALARQGEAVWLGTYDGGLTRIDANGAMRHFSAAADGLPSDTILALAVDADGVLWVGTTAGLARRRGDGAFERVALPGAEGEPMVYALAGQPDGMWAMNCGYGRGFSVLEVLDAVDRVTGGKLRRVMSPRRAGDPDSLVSDPSRIKATLPWVPQHADLDQIVRHALAWEEKLAGIRRAG